MFIETGPPDWVSYARDIKLKDNGVGSSIRDGRSAEFWLLWQTGVPLTWRCETFRVTVDSEGVNVMQSDFQADYLSDIPRCISARRSNCLPESLYPTGKAE